MIVSGRDVARDVPMWGKIVAADNIEIQPYAVTAGKNMRSTPISLLDFESQIPQPVVYNLAAFSGGAVPVAAVSAVAQKAVPIVTNIVKTGLSKDELNKPVLVKNKESVAEVLWYLMKKDGGANGTYKKILKILGEI